jgi:hypothetical protein
MESITQLPGHPTPSTSWFDSANVSRYCHLMVQPHLQVANSWCNSANVSQYRHLMVQPHLQLVNSWCQHRHLTVQPHLQVVNCRSTGSRYHTRHLTVQPLPQVVKWAVNDTPPTPIYIFTSKKRVWWQDPSYLKQHKHLRGSGPQSSSNPVVLSRGRRPTTLGCRTEGGIMRYRNNKYL